MIFSYKESQTHHPILALIIKTHFVAYRILTIQFILYYFNQLDLSEYNHECVSEL